MRDVLELRQIKLELAAYMGEECPPTPTIISDGITQEEKTESLAVVAEADEVVQGDEVEAEASMPTTPLLEASPLLEQSELPKTSAVNTSDSSSSTVSQYVPAPTRVSTSSSASLSRGLGMEIDLHSLIVPTSSLEEVDEEEDQHRITEEAPSSSSSNTVSASSDTVLTPSSSASSSEPSLSASNSLSCSPATSDSESFDNLSSSTEEDEFDDSSSSSRRGSDDTSCDDDEAEEEEEEATREGVDFDCVVGVDTGVEVYERDVDMMVAGIDNARTPTRLSSLLRKPQHANSQLNATLNSQHHNRYTSTSPLSSAKKNTKKDQFDVGCITIALPTLGGDGFTKTGQATTFDLSATTNHCDPWNPSTF